MSSQIYLHVGSPKSGTTFLQQVLWSQRELAERQGLTLPLGSFNDHYWGSLDVRGLAGKRNHPVKAMGTWDRLAGAALSAPTPRVLISHELYGAASADQARKALSRFGAADVHVVITARDLVRQITAEWQEHIKHRATATLDEFVANLRRTADDRKGWFWRVQDPVRLATTWGAKLPPDRVHVVTLPPAGAGSGLLWRRFAGLLGLDPSAFDVVSQRRNTSLGLEQAELLRRVNQALGARLPVPGPYPGVAKDILAHRVLAAQEGTPLGLDAETMGFAREQSERIATELDKLGVDVVGSLDELIPEVDVNAKPLPEPSAEAMLTAGVSAIADLLEVLAERAEQVKYERRELHDFKSRPVRSALGQMADDKPAVRKALGAWERFTAVAETIRANSVDCATWLFPGDDQPADVRVLVAELGQALAFVAFDAATGTFDVGDVPIGVDELTLAYERLGGVGRPGCGTPDSSPPRRSDIRRDGAGSGGSAGRGCAVGTGHRGRLAPGGG
ncbi:MAG: hypothetical protein QM655_13205 [Nocardioidaceae bacterium]